MITAMVMGVLAIISCIAAAGLIASTTTGLDAAQAIPGLEFETEEGV